VPATLLVGAYEKLWYAADEQHRRTAGAMGRGAVHVRLSAESLSTVDVTYWPQVLEKGVGAAYGSPRAGGAGSIATGKAVGALYYDATARCVRCARR